MGGGTIAILISQPSLSSLCPEQTRYHDPMHRLRVSKSCHASVDSWVLFQGMCKAKMLILHTVASFPYLDADVGQRPEA